MWGKRTGIVKTILKKKSWRSPLPCIRDTMGTVMRTVMFTEIMIDYTDQWTRTASPDKPDTSLNSDFLQGCQIISWVRSASLVPE